MMDLIDSHAHVDFPTLTRIATAVLDRARAAGVGTLLAIGTGPGPKSWMPPLPFAEEHDWIYASRWHSPARSRASYGRALGGAGEALAKHPRVIALGRNRPRLPLRFFSARNAAAKFFADQLGAGARS